jgi:hypothetical protein
MISPKVAIAFILATDPESREVYLPQIRRNSKDLTIPLFWFKLKVMRGQRLRVGRSLLLATCLLVPPARPLSSAVKQVRVTQERASIYIEPSRTSARIDIVVKGTVLNLLQESKVKDIWYYVSYNSPRYRSRISGFIQDSAVELAVPGSPAAPPVKEEKAPPKAEPEKPRPAETVPPAPPRIVESLAATGLPKGRTHSFPRRTASLQDVAWRIVETPPVLAKEKPIAVRESAALTPLPKRRALNLPRKERPPEDAPWRIVQPVIAQAAPPRKSVETKPAPPEIKKEPATPKPTPPEVKKETAARQPESKPAEATPVKTQPIVTPPVGPPQKGPGFLSLGLGYGGSFGGAGGCLQLNSRWGLSLHAGVGLYPTSLVYSETDWVKNEMLWSVGLKYYLPLGSPSFTPFIDLQYGGLRVEAAQVIIGIWDYQYVFSHEQKSLWGPSLLAGCEFRLGHLAFTGAVGAAYATTSWDYAESQVSFVFETGLIVHF